MPPGTIGGHGGRIRLAIRVRVRVRVYLKLFLFKKKAGFYR